MRKTISFQRNLIICFWTDRQVYIKKYSSCLDAMTNGKIHPEPGNPVTLVLQDNSIVQCSIENLNKQVLIENISDVKLFLNINSQIFNFSRLSHFIP